MKPIPFVKMEALQNDFIVTMEELATPEQAKIVAQKYCDRRSGVGADSLLYLHSSDEANIGMRIFERDGSKSDMCGNGLRCVGVVGRWHDISDLSVETKSGMLEVRHIRDNIFEANIGRPKYTYIHGVSYDEISVGEPHRVLEWDKKRYLDFEMEAKHLKDGDDINVNIYRVLDDNVINVRTYERGVEGETMACGTGITACAIHYMDEENPLMQSDIEVETKGGTAVVRPGGYGYRLEGPANAVYYGEVEI